MKKYLFSDSLQNRISRCLILLTLLLSVGVWGQVYREDFGTSATPILPYNSGTNATGSVIKNVNITTPSWNQNLSSGGFAGNPTGAMSATTGTATYIVTCTFSVNAGYKFLPTSIGFDNRASSTGPNALSINISGTGGSTSVSLTPSKTGAFVTTSPTNFANVNLELTGNITLAFTFTGGASGSTERLDNIILNGTVTPSCTSPTITFPSGSITQNVGDPNFTSTVSSTSSGAVTYSSNNPTVASVNSTTGEVTVGTAGTAIITASQAASGVYCAGTATYTVTVNSTSPTINATGTLSAVSSTYGTASANTSFTVSATNLTSNLVITPPIGFEISESSTFVTSNTYASPLSITPSSAAVSSRLIYVRLAATSPAATYSGNIVLTSAGATTVNVATVASTVNPKGLTITGLTATGKVYDGDPSASVTGTPAYVGLENGETFTVNSTGVTWAFSTKNVGATLTRSGNYPAPNTNYTVTQPTLTASITPKTLTIAAPSIASRVYSSGVTTTGTVTPGALIGLIGTDTSTVAVASSNYADDTAGIGKTASINYTLGNSNYTIANPNAGTGDITKATPVFTTSPIGIVISGTYTLPGSNISSTSPGALSYSLTSNGYATLNIATGVITAGSNVGMETLTVNQAASTNYNAVITSVVVNVVSFSTGDYMSTSNGTWKSGGSGTATWKMFNGSTWVAVSSGSEPSTSTTKNVYIWNSIQLQGTFSASNIIIENGGTIDTNLITPTFTNILVKSGGTFLQNGYTKINTGGILEVLDGGIFNFYCKNGSTRTSTIWNGLEKFHPNSTFKITNADTTGTYYLFENIDDIDTYTDTSTGYSACFGNVIIDNANGSALQILPAGFNRNFAHHNVTFVSNASNKVFCTGSYTTGIGGNFIFDTTYNQTFSFLSSANTANITIKGNLINNSTKIVRLLNNATGTANLTIEGDINLTNTGSVDLNFTSGGTSTVNLKGDLAVGSTAALIATNGTTATLNFSGTGDGLTDATTQTISVANAATASNIAFNVNSGAYVKLITQDLSLGTNSSFTVKSGAAFDFGFNGTTALSLTRVSGTSGQSFNAATGSTLKISSPDGIVLGSTTPAADLYKGNVQIGATEANRYFDPAATYHFIGKANAAQLASINAVDQISGTGLPGAASAKNIIVELNTSNSAQDDVSFKAIGINKFTSLGSLKIIKGKVVDEAGNGFADGTAEDGKLYMTGGRYKISRSGTQPSIGGDYSLTGGVIEFAGAAAIEVRTGSTPKEYLNVEVSGTNVKAGTTNTTGLTFQSGGKFTVKGAGIFKVPNTSGFSGGTSTAVKDTNNPTIILEPLSTIDYTGANQTVTVALPYENLNVSGSGISSPVTNTNLTVNNVTTVSAGTLKILDTTDSATPNVFTSKKGVKVIAPGNVILANNANLMQDDTAFTNSGSITVQRIAKLKFESAAKADYNYWSSPVIDQKLLYNATTPLVQSFSPGTPNNRIFEYKESNDTFVATLNPNFIAGKAYAIRAENGQNGSAYTADGVAKTFEFLGEPNNGNVTTPNLTKKDNDHGYNMIGNPYPSNINFDKFWLANQSKMYSTAYFWTNNQYYPTQQGSGYTGNNYAILNGTGGNPAAYQVTSGSPIMPTEYIKPGQGFIIQMRSAGTLTFTNSMREVGTGPFYNNKNNSSKDRFWVSLTSPSNIVNNILVGYVQGATNGFEKDFDAPLLVEGSDAFYSVLGTQKLAIQGKDASFSTYDIVPVGTKHFENGIYKIALSKKEGLFETQPIYLKDKALNKIVNLNAGDYSFTALKGTDATRFEIVYKDDLVLGAEETDKSDFIVYRDGADYVVSSNSILDKVEVYDATGRMIFSKKTTEKNIRLDGSSLINGLYIIKVENSGNVKTKKILK